MEIVLYCFHFLNFFIGKDSTCAVFWDGFRCVAHEEPHVYPSTDYTANEKELERDVSGVEFWMAQESKERTEEPRPFCEVLFEFII